jgi:hypothetical protein
MANRQAKVPKSPDERMRDCETHLAFLKEARDKYRTDPERYKQVAAELRVLVCTSRTNTPLLLDLMDEYGFEYEVQPSASPAGPPLKGPIPLVGWRDDPVQQALAKELEQAGDDKQKLNAVLARQQSLRVALPLRRFVDEGLAAFIAPYEYSYNLLTRAIAEQSGGAHEDAAIDEGLAAMRNFRIGGDDSHIRVLISFADTILRAGLKFLAFMEARHGYQIRRFQFASATPSPSAPVITRRAWLFVALGIAVILILALALRAIKLPA